MRIMLLLVALLLSACSLFVTEPQVKVQGLTVIGLGSEGVDLEALLAVNNPNAFPLTLAGCSYDLQVLALPLAQGGVRQRLEFPAAGTTAVRLPFRVRYRDLLAILKRHPDLDKVPYVLSGGLEVETPFGTSRVPLRAQGDFRVPERYRPSSLLGGGAGLVNGLQR